MRLKFFSQAVAKRLAPYRATVQAGLPHSRKTSRMPQYLKAYKEGYEDVRIVYPRLEERNGLANTLQECILPSPARSDTHD